jgi:hypothetical protein
MVSGSNDRVKDFSDALGRIDVYSDNRSALVSNASVKLALSLARIRRLSSAILGLLLAKLFDTNIIAAKCIHRSSSSPRGANKP